MADRRQLTRLPRDARRALRRRSLAAAERALLGPLVGLLVMAADRRLRRAHRAPEDQPPG